MREKDFLPAIKKAISKGDSGLAQSLEGLHRDFREGEDSYEFVDASQEAKRQADGLEKCVIIHGLPRNTTPKRAQELAEYLVREARRRNATYSEVEEADPDEEDSAGSAIESAKEGTRYEYVVARFPGAPEDNYDVEAFIGSIVHMAENPRQAIIESESDTV